MGNGGVDRGELAVAERRFRDARFNLYRGFRLHDASTSDLSGRVGGNPRRYRDIRPGDIFFRLEPLQYGPTAFPNIVTRPHWDATLVVGGSRVKHRFTWNDGESLALVASRETTVLLDDWCP